MVIERQNIGFNINTQFTSRSDEKALLVNVNIKFTIAPNDFKVRDFKIETLNKRSEALEIYEIYITRRWFVAKNYQLV